MTDGLVADTRAPGCVVAGGDVEEVGPVGEVGPVLLPLTDPGSGWLFPPAAGQATVTGEIAWAAGTGTAVAALSAIRMPGMFDSLWAEDAHLFLGQALTMSFAESLPVSYAGYFHLIPRLIVHIASWFPLSWAAAVVALGVLLVAGLGAAVVEVGAGASVRRRWLRVGLALPIAVLPSMGQEVMGAAANVQWVLAYVCFWALLWVPTGRRGQALAALVLVASALSSVLLVSLLPLAGLRLVLRRPGRWVTGLFVAVLAGHAAVVHHLAVRQPSPGEPSERVARAVAGFSRGVLANFLPGMPTDRLDMPGTSLLLPGRRGILFVACLLVALGVLVVGLLRRPVDRWRLFVAGVAVLTAVAAWSLEMAVAGLAPRYCVFPALLLVAAAVVVIDGGIARWPSPVGSVAAVVATGALTLSAVLGWPVSDLRTGEPRTPWWGAGVEAARVRCRTGEGVVGDAVSIPVLPDGWVVVVPCRTLSG